MRCGYTFYDIYGIVINYLLTESEVFTVKYQTKVCIDRVIARSIQQGRGLIFYRKNQTVEVNKFLYGTFYYENQYSRN